MKIDGIPQTFKFIIVFTLCVLLPLYIYLYIENTDSTIRLKRFSNQKIHYTCLNSPRKMSFSKCMQKDLSYILVDASFMDLQKIQNSLHQVWDFDKKNAIDISVASFDFYKSYEIIVDHINNFYIKRNSIQFAQLIYLPILRFLILQKAKNVKEQLKSFIKESDLNEIKREKLNKILLKLKKITNE